MNNEEAIINLKNIKYFMILEDRKNNHKFLPSNYEAIDLAIKVLEQREEIREIVWNNGTYDGYKICKLRKLIERRS